MDWILKQAFDGGREGLDWLYIGENKLADLDFTDDIVLFDATWKGMQQQTNKIKDVASKVDLHIHAGKTKLMQIGIFEGQEVNTIQIKAEGGEIESVEEFCYLGSGVSRHSSCDRVMCFTL